jgi:predicted permease
MWQGLDGLGREVKRVARALMRAPAFTATAVLSLALGIGANAGLFSLIDQALLRSLPVRDPQQLVLLEWQGKSLSATWGNGSPLSYPLCRDVAAQKQFFDGVFCRHPTTVNLSAGQQYEQVNAEIVSGTYFPVLGIQPALGRLIQQDDDLQPNAHPVAVLSHAYWKDRLASDRAIVGRRVFINSHPMTVIGVAPAGFQGMDFGEAPAVWIPAMMKTVATTEWDRLMDRRAAWMHVFARLPRGVTAEQTAARLRPWFSAVLEADTQLDTFPRVTPNDRREFLASTLAVQPGAQGWSSLRRTLQRPLWVLMAGTTLLLLLACLNIAGLLLARGATRQGEVLTCLALGATWPRVARPFLIEGMLVATAGGLLSLLVAPAVARILMRFLPENAGLSPRVDVRVFLFALAVSLVTGVLAGLIPAVKAARHARVSSINVRSRVAMSGHARLRKAIVVMQIAFTLILLIVAGLFIQTLQRLQHKDHGFDRGGVVMFRLDPPGIGYSTADGARVMRELRQSLQRTPGVEHAALANTTLLTGGGFSRVLTIDGDQRTVTDGSVPGLRVSPDFFATLGTRIVAGRDFTDADTQDFIKTGYRSVIVNESFARKYFGGRNAIGRRVGVGNRPDTKTTIEIVGVVADFSFRSVRDDAKPEHVFFPFVSEGPLAADGMVFLRVRGRPEASFAAIRTAVAAIDPRLPLLGLTTLEAQIDRSLRSERMMAALSTSFGALALLLSAVGLYGVMSLAATQRTQEIGVRLALGATRGSAVWLIVRAGLVMIAIGTAIGLPAAWALRRLVEAQLYGVGAFDAPTIVFATAVLAMAGFAAAALPAWRAASINPTEALRSE